MSARKLQQEFDKTNKKISEGLTLFDDTYEKLLATELSSQRDKFEADLKKEIKKLQRLRDQLKQWLGDSGIKLDKNILQDNRTKIEHAMDQFKDLEKLSKIKQFSNEGLELQTKKGKIARYGDMNDEKKQEACSYISDILEQLESQNDELEREIHQNTLQLKKAKSSVASSLQQSIEDFRYKVERNNDHIGRLDQVIRNIENEELKPEKLDLIKDDLEYYVENNQDDEYIEYNEFYDLLEIETGPTEAEREEQERKEREAKEEQERLLREEQEKRDKERREKERKEKEDQDKKDQTRKSRASPGASAVKKPSMPASQPAPAPALASGTSYSNAIKGALGENTTPQAPAPVTNVYSSGTTIAEAVSNAAAVAAAAATGSEASVKTPTATAATMNGNSNVNTPNSKPLPPGLNGNNLSKVSTAKSSTSSPIPQNSELSRETPIPQTELPEDYENKTFTDTIPQLSTIIQTRLRNPLPFKSISTLLENSLYNCPDSFDSEVPRQYNPKNVHPSSIDYPQEPMFELNTMNVMKKFDNDTLFYCFYYSDGIYNLSRINAAKELTKRGWVYHTELKQWFFQDNKSNDLKYFDYEKTWLIRRKDIELNNEVTEAFL